MALVHPRWRTEISNQTSNDTFMSSTLLIFGMHYDTYPIVILLICLTASLYLYFKSSISSNKSR